MITREKIQRVQEDFLLKKGKKVPVGTVTGNYKKVAEGKWVPVKKDKSSKTKDAEPKTLKGKLQKELKNAKVEHGSPDVQMYVDNSSIYWATDSGEFLFIQDHDGIDDYVDEDHKVEGGVKAEGVGSEGVYWNNLDFGSPYHISDFEDAIETVNI
jgi:hypothetical protein